MYSSNKYCSYYRAFKSDTQTEKFIVNLPGLSILMMLLSTYYALMHSKWKRYSNFYFVKKSDRNSSGNCNSDKDISLSILFNKPRGKSALIFLFKNV